MNQDSNTQHSCEDKITYESPEEARAADAANSHHYDKPRLTVYTCRNCGLYHLTQRQSDDAED